MKLETMRRINAILKSIKQLERERSAIDNEQELTDSLKDSIDERIANLSAERIELSEG